MKLVLNEGGLVHVIWTPEFGGYLLLSYLYISEGVFFSSIVIISLSGSGMKMGSAYGDLMAFGGNKVTARQRWTPSNMQLEILERIYDEANGTPGKHRVKEITKELSQHGHVTETNVYNWFQNRRARTKRKQSVPARNISDSDIEPEVISPKDKRTKPEDMYFQSPESGVENFSE